MRGLDTLSNVENPGPPEIGTLSNVEKRERSTLSDVENPGPPEHVSTKCGVSEEIGDAQTALDNDS